MHHVCIYFERGHLRCAFSLFVCLALGAVLSPSVIMSFPTHHPPTNQHETKPNQTALDNQSEKIVQAALDRLVAARKRTTIVIAHR